MFSLLHFSSAQLQVQHRNPEPDPKKGQSGRESFPVNREKL